MADLKAVPKADLMADHSVVLSDWMSDRKRAIRTVFQLDDQRVDRTAEKTVVLKAALKVDLRDW